MTAEELQNFTDEYFSVHIDNAFWCGLDESLKAGAIKMATIDVLSRLKYTLLSNLKPTDFATMAIAEQAIYLARNHESLTSGRVTTSEAIDGISVGYQYIHADIGLSFRASAYIDKAKLGEKRAVARINRG